MSNLILRSTALNLGFFFLTTVLVSCTSGVPIDQAHSSSRPTEDVLYDEFIDPHEQLAKAVKEASAKKRPILMQIGGNWCRDAHRLDAFYEQHPQVKQIIEDKFVFIRVNIHRENPISPFFDNLPHFSWVPTLMILDASGRILTVQEGTQLEIDNEYSPDLIISFLQSGATANED